MMVKSLAFRLGDGRKDPKVSTGQALFEESVFTFDGLMLIPK